jgi:hypothetical protein
LIRDIVRSYTALLDEGYHVESVAYYMIDLLKRIAVNRSLNLVDLVFITESEILENLAVTYLYLIIIRVKIHSSLLIDFIEMVLLFRNFDSLCVIEISNRLDSCNAH